MNKRDQTLIDQERVVLYQVDDWMIGEFEKDRLRHPDHPLISHWCRGSWNYAFSSEYAMRAFIGHSLYECSGCEKRAPDRVITIHTMLVK
jgi:hypothetical protein